MDGVYHQLDQYALRQAYRVYVSKEGQRVVFILFIAIGGDGGPGSGLSYLISFLNVGERIVCSPENFLLFGGNIE